MTISPIGKVRAVVVRRDPEQEWFASVCRRSERRVHRRRPEECREAWKGAANTGERGDAAERRENRVRTPGANDDDHYTRGTAREVDLQLQRLVSSLAQLRGGGRSAATAAHGDGDPTCGKGFNGQRIGRSGAPCRALPGADERRLLRPTRGGDAKGWDTVRETRDRRGGAVVNC